MGAAIACRASKHLAKNTLKGQSPHPILTARAVR